MRKADYPVDDLFITRHSSLAIADEPLSHDELYTLLEAARWAPSSYNNQPWRYVYAMQGTSAWEHLFETMVPYNQQWAAPAPALVLITSRKTFALNGKQSITHAFDAGSSWQSLCLQASTMGIVVRGVAGFDYEKARLVMQVPDAYEIHAIAVIGKPGTKEDLPLELQAKETWTDRTQVQNFVYEGTMGVYNEKS